MGVCEFSPTFPDAAIAMLEIMAVCTPNIAYFLTAAVCLEISLQLA